MMEVVWLPECQQWAFEVHPEVCFWAMNGEHPMAHNKKTEAGVNDRLNLLRTVFPDIQRHLLTPLPGVEKDDLLDAAAASELLRPYDARLMRCYPISARINHVWQTMTKPALHPWNSQRFRIGSCFSGAVRLSDVRVRRPQAEVV